MVDHDPELRRLLVTRLGAAHYAVETAESAQAALHACVRSRPNLIITELRVTDMDGLAFLRELKNRWPQLTVIILTAHATIAEAVRATQAGAFGFLVKPVGKEELLGQVQRAIADSSFALTEGDWRANVVSRSQLMEDRLAMANSAARSDMPVLLTGQSGTGKELFARAIHAAGARRDKPFVAISCRDTSRDALEIALFGGESDESGAASVLQEGAFRRAQGGTLLIDEIGDLPLKLQAALAQLLAKHHVTSTKSLGAEYADARLICTTSRDLEPLIESGAFLCDLHRQITVLPIEIPPLGRRREDIPLLVSHFLEQASEPGAQKKIYSPEAIQLLATTDWPGNVRQLFELVKQNVAMSQGRVITREQVQRSLSEDPAKMPTLDEAREKFSRDYLAVNLQLTAGNVTQAARLAKRSRTDFYKLLARYRLHPDDFKAGTSAAQEEGSADSDE
ncbi:MAG TPA: sigma 54-interacting transcriptional regulator [Steroidobacteraceae bacterium]|nr:sigma 54-interacting transcriptional regulator [Steroidobacteraceae bacterium]